MVNTKWQMAAAGLIALLAALYMMEVAVNDDEAVIIGSTQVIMITECSRVFQFVGDLSNYAMWFPGIENMTASSPGPMRAGKEFEETVILPAFGEISREVVVTSYSVPRQLQFVYRDFSQTMIAIELIQKTADRCHLYYSAATRRTSYLFHVTAGIPLRIMYAMRGRHAMFAIRSMFNN
ncbi:hypothetical protein EB796_019191 [Bugula neritina]|uniref:Uncharacterized protein n=1 Tax=Bugula neritina TaxID=10212 RepID=A0A7J7J924_BUGNE|nr:hypothetical protein EB796_019191 [Bugula neritina]